MLYAKRWFSSNLFAPLALPSSCESLEEKGTLNDVCLDFVVIFSLKKKEDFVVIFLGSHSFMSVEFVSNDENKFRNKLKIVKSLANICALL